MTTLTRTSHMLALMLHLLWLDKTHTCCHFCLLHWVSPDDGTLYAGHWTLQAKLGHQPTHLLLHQVQILTSETVHALHNLVNLSWCKIGIFLVCNSYRFRGGLFLPLYEVQCELGDQSNCQRCLDGEECPNMHSLSSRLLPSFSSSSIHPLFSSSYRPHPFLIIIFLSFISIIAVIIISTAPVKEQSGVQRSGLIGLQISEIAICVGGVYGKVIPPMQNMMLTNETQWWRWCWRWLW